MSSQDQAPENFPAKSYEHGLHYEEESHAQGKSFRSWRPVEALTTKLF
jgi:hypothetical protein